MHECGCHPYVVALTLQALQEENARLREQVEHLQRLAAMATATAAGGSGPDATALGRRAAAPAGAAPAQRPYSASAAEAARGPVAALAAANAAGVHLQQYKSQVVQLQRQVALMSREMEVGRGGGQGEGEGMQWRAGQEDAMLGAIVRRRQHWGRGGQGGMGAMYPIESVRTSAVDLGGGGGNGGSGLVGKLMVECGGVIECRQSTPCRCRLAAGPLHAVASRRPTCLPARSRRPPPPQAKSRMAAEAEGALLATAERLQVRQGGALHRAWVVNCWCSTRAAGGGTPASAAVMAMGMYGGGRGLVCPLHGCRPHIS